MHTWVKAVVSFVATMVFRFVEINGVVIEKIAFSWNIWHLTALVLIAIGVSAVCWVIRANAMKYVSVSAVAVKGKTI